MQLGPLHFLFTHDAEAYLYFYLELANLALFD